MASDFPKLALFLVFNLLSANGKRTLVNHILEDGYTVTTVIDGHKLKINPHAVHFRSGSSDLVVLDSAGSAFYTVPFPISQEGINPFSGDGVEGYSDGESGTARFNKPRSFAIDRRGNVYVADKFNHVIRKISGSGTGVTTIAGGYTQKTGALDGPAQNATFSDDFELDFVAETCALLVSDHGNQLVRQINLKAEDCSGSSSSGGELFFVFDLDNVAVGLSCLIGFVVGLALRPYIRIFHEGKRVHRFNETWKHCLIRVGKQVQIHCCAIRSVVADYYLVWSLLGRLFWLCQSHISLLFRTDYLVVPQVSSSESVSLLDTNIVSSGSEITEMTKSSKYDDQLKDLMGFDGSLELCNQMLEQKGEEENGERSFHRTSRIEDMIETNVLHFEEVAKDHILVDGSLLASSGLVKRR
ncbi:hypothetical protein FNV43_RR26034 [Rhamnella rubrinervis]|uniref:NHL repeat-containing protein n=1 Tax=Rhamnella rubrinervis TaxID=2594499 RepID=A0A8K0DLU8_9ROSA|nr:hypothetical protein FNV43_RR26034 [Rhamnella rubrinervis]